MLKTKQVHNNLDNILLSNIILESKPYIYKPQQIEWINYVKKTINSSINIQELGMSSYIIQKLGSNELSIEDSVELLKYTDFSLESMYLIVDNILYFYKDGPNFYKAFFKDYLSPKFESSIEKIEIRNNEYLKSIK